MVIGSAYGDGFTGVLNFFDEDSFVFISGDEDTDGSVRFTLDRDTRSIARTELRFDGVWVLSDFEARLRPASVGHWLVDRTRGTFVLDPNGEPVEEG